ncbi:MAG: Stp1/IreP family PP2C-type Ser/Thr phosphatase [Thermoanaerobaculia bacterium]
MRLRACGLSDVGRSRNHNEDHFEIVGDGRLCVVADGMGGHGHGDLASRIAVEAILEHVDAAPTGAGDPAKRSQLLERAINGAHHKLLERVAADEELVGMGTTTVVMLVDDASAIVAHVGDSRAYRLRQGDLELLTEDHSWVNEQVRAGFLSVDQARSHPLKNVVTRALGGEAGIQVDVEQIEVQPEDLYLLCSDGLTTMLRDEEIGERLQEVGERTVEEVCSRLVGDANERGGLDNVTVVLLAVEE